MVRLASVRDRRGSYAPSLRSEYKSWLGSCFLRLLLHQDVVLTARAQPDHLVLVFPPRRNKVLLAAALACAFLALSLRHTDRSDTPLISRINGHYSVSQALAVYHLR